MDFSHAAFSEFRSVFHMTLFATAIPEIIKNRGIVSI